jgi:hypothetical protein
MANILHWIVGCFETANCYRQTKTNKKQRKKKEAVHELHYTSKAKWHWVEHSQQKHDINNNYTTQK